MKISDCTKVPHVLVEVNLTNIGNITENPELAQPSPHEPISPISTSEIFHRPSHTLSVSGEEIGIVSIVLILWIAAIALFINRWGKIRLMEPYHPYIRPESNAEPLSDDTAGDGSRRMSSNPRASMDGTTIPQRRKSIFPGPITLEIPSTSPRNSMSSSQMDRRKSVLDLWTSQSAVQLRNMHDRRRSCLSDFSASRRESFFLHRRESYFSAQPTKLSPMSCHYNSNRSVSLHPYFYLNSKTPPTLRYTPASTEKSDKSSLSPPPLMDILPNYTSPIQNYPLEGEVVTRIQIHDEKDSLSNSSDQYYHQVNSKVMNRRYSINGLEDDEGDIQNEEEERDEVSVAYSHSDTRSSKVSEV